MAGGKAGARGYLSAPVTIGGCSIIAAVFAWSLYRPRDLLTWLLEALPVLLGAPLLALTCRAFPLTPLAYILLGIHACVLLVGGHYT